METLRVRDHNNLPLTINLLHGEGFKNTNPCTSMELYIKAQIITSNPHNKTKTIHKTPTDKRNGENPIWNSEMKFDLNHTKILEPGGGNFDLLLQVKASSQVGLFRNRKLGEVRLPVKRLYERVAAEDMVVGWTAMRCPVVGAGGRCKGSVYLSYRFGIFDEVKYGDDAVLVAPSAPPLPPIGMW